MALDRVDPNGSSHERVLDWWASAIDRQARMRPEAERPPLYARIVYLPAGIVSHQSFVARRIFPYDHHGFALLPRVPPAALRSRPTRSGIPRIFT